MNRSMVRYILLKVMEFIGVFLLFPCIVALCYREREGIYYIALSIICMLIGFLGTRKKPTNQVFYAKEGFVSVALSWIIIGIIGAIPFVLTGEIPNFVDALFETISGFTTTGASILTNVEALSHCSLFWRSYTHWIGGMGVLVFILAILPASGGYNMHIMRAESPGPSVGKLVPKVQTTAMILYGIYFAMTLIEIILLYVFGMPLFDSLTISFGTAGTGGFGVLNSSIAEYPVICQSIITVFMILFGVNFSVYYLILMRRFKQAFQCEEVRWYLGIILTSTILIAINIRDIYTNGFEAFHQAAFHVGTIITTTGYSIADFNTWPAFSKTVLVTLMFVGACAGSTGGGLKVSRIIIYVKGVLNKIDTAIHPRRVRVVHFEKHIVNEAMIGEVHSYLAAFILIYIGSVLIISLDNFDYTTNFTAVAATINNIGPGLNEVGPASNFSAYSWLSKLVFILDMLVGRLEVFPVLVLFSPHTWKNTPKSNGFKRG